TDRGEEAGIAVQLLPDRVGAEQYEMDLHVRRSERRIGLEEAAGVPGADAERPLTRQRVLHRHADAAAPRRHRVVDGDRLAAAIVEARLEVVLQIGADARRVAHHRNAEGPEQFAWADAGELQQLRRVEGAAGENDLAIGAGAAQLPVLPVFDADGARPFK